MILGKPDFYKAGAGGVSAVVGVESKTARIARYAVIAPAVGASLVRLRIQGSYLGGGQLPGTLRCYIGTQPDSHTNATANSAYSCILTRSGTDYTGSANIILLPSARYYIWVFPADFKKYGWLHWPINPESATMDTEGAAASTITASSGTLGTDQVIRITRYSANAVHTLSATCGSDRATIATGIQADSYTWVPPVSWAAQAPNGTSVYAKIQCDTVLAGKTVGTAYANCTMAIPGSVQPTVAMTLKDVSGVRDELGTFVRGKSRLQVIVTADSLYGAKITEYQITVGRATLGQQKATFDLDAAGQISVVGKAKDTRGRWGKITQTITVAPYSPPTAEITDVYRCDKAGNRDMTGSYASIVFDASVDKLVAASARYMVRSRQRGATAWEDHKLPQYNGQQDLVGAGVILPADPKKAFEFAVVVSDRWTSGNVSPYRNCPLAFALIQLHHERQAIGIGTQAGDPQTCTIGLDTYFNRPQAPAGFIRQSTIEAGDDANNYRTPGMYICKTNSIAQKVKNLPCPYGGSLWVQNAQGDTRVTGPYVYLHQYYRPIEIKEPTYRRMISSNANGVWVTSDWYK